MLFIIIIIIQHICDLKPSQLDIQIDIAIDRVIEMLVILLLFANQSHHYIKCIIIREGTKKKCNQKTRM